MQEKKRRKRILTFQENKLCHVQLALRRNKDNNSKLLFDLNDEDLQLQSLDQYRDQVSQFQIVI